MKYISIGAVMHEGSEHILDVCRGGNSFRLTGERAALWLNGRQGFAYAEKPTELQTLEHLVKMGLAVKADGSAAEEYHALTRCTLVPANRKFPYLGLKSQEKTVLRWLREAGLVLSMAELTFLMDRGIELQDGLLGSDNAQALVETIYTKETICDNILENQMEHAAAREQTVKAVLNLLKKKRIVLL